TLDVFRRDVLGGASSPPPPPTISGFLPASGVGGTRVTINGTALAGATDVEFGGVSASFTVVSDAKITAAVPSGAPGLSTISVTTPFATFTSATAFKVRPTLASSSPSPARAGDTVSVTASNLADVSLVRLGAVGVPFVVDDPTHLHIALADAALTGNLTAIGPGGTSAPLKIAIAPTITSLAQTSGVAGASLTITGKTFAGTTRVTFGSATAPGPFTVLSTSQLKVTVPASAVSGPITVTNADGSTASAASFHVLPKLTSFTPAQAVAATTVTITGTGLAGTTGVSFNGSPAGSLVSVTATSVKATVPADATVGQIVVTTAEGSAASTASFKPLPKLTSSSPNPAHAGDTITVTGSNLTHIPHRKLG